LNKRDGPEIDCIRLANETRCRIGIRRDVQEGFPSTVADDHRRNGDWQKSAGAIPGETEETAYSALDLSERERSHRRVCY
jgi:hypothetical protein